ncbi:MAG TPA: hypothetical protein PKL31_01635 [Fulvivirga sp.]|nr:hypothetical protein [Fulvivirga sp.]
MRYVPSPVKLHYTIMYSATANPSGRMQYHKIKPKQTKERISRTEFIEAFNSLEILAIRPLPAKSSPVFQLEFYT